MATSTTHQNQREQLLKQLREELQRQEQLEAECERLQGLVAQLQSEREELRRSVNVLQVERDDYLRAVHAWADQQLSEQDLARFVQEEKSVDLVQFLRQYKFVG